MQLTSSKNGSQFTCPGQEVTFTCRVFGSNFVEWRNPNFTQSTLYEAPDEPPNRLSRDPFTALLINVSSGGTPLNANFISTLQVNASRMFIINQTTVMCISNSANRTDTFTSAGKSCN